MYASVHFLDLRFHPRSAQTSMTTKCRGVFPEQRHVSVAGMLPSSQYLMHARNSLTISRQRSRPEHLQPGRYLEFPQGAGDDFKHTPRGHDAAFPVVLFQLVPTLVARSTTGQAATTYLQAMSIWYYPGQLLVTRTEMVDTSLQCRTRFLASTDLAGNEPWNERGDLERTMAAKGTPS